MKRTWPAQATLALVGACLLVGGVASAQGPPAASSSPATAGKRPADSPEQLAAWARQLDADEFLTRDTATLRLLEAGGAALPALKPVLASGSLEATSRGLFILQQLGLGRDIDTQEQAWRQLAELAQRQETPAVARRAAAALEELTARRSVQALAELEALGAKVNRGQVFNGLPIEAAVASLELGEAFQGTEADLRRLKWLSDVPSLILSGAKVTDAWVQQAVLMPGLTEIHFYQAGISDAGLAPLAGHPSLAQIGLYYTPVGDGVLAPLTKLPLLSFMKLYGTRITPAGLAQFKAASGLASIDERRGAFLGVGCFDVDGTCTVSTVHDGSPAEKGGLLRDDQIVRFAEVRVTSFDTLTDRIALCNAGDEVELEVVRRTFDERGEPVLRQVVTKVKLAPWELELAVRQGPRPAR